jgi:hypothetical protein
MIGHNVSSFGSPPLIWWCLVENEALERKIRVGGNVSWHDEQSYPISDSGPRTVRNNGGAIGCDRFGRRPSVPLCAERDCDTAGTRARSRASHSATIAGVGGTIQRAPEIAEAQEAQIVATLAERKPALLAEPTPRLQA